MTKDVREKYVTITKDEKRDVSISTIISWIIIVVALYYVIFEYIDKF